MNKIGDDVKWNVDKMILIQLSQYYQPLRQVYINHLVSSTSSMSHHKQVINTLLRQFGNEYKDNQYVQTILQQIQ